MIVIEKALHFIYFSFCDIQLLDIRKYLGGAKVLTLSSNPINNGEDNIFLSVKIVQLYIENKH